MIIDGRFEFFNEEEALHTPEGTCYSRVPLAVRAQMSETAQNVATLSATGAEIRFVFNEGCDKAELQVYCENEFVTLGLYYGCFQGGWQWLGNYGLFQGENRVPIARPENIERLREVAGERGDAFSPDVMRLCIRSGRLRDVRLEGDVRPPRPDETPRGRVLFYGSSITHGSLSHLPGSDYATRVCAQLGMDRINKGMAGTCLMEKAVADYLAVRDDYDFAVYELGSNIPDTMSEEEFCGRVKYLLLAYAKAHPDKPLFVIDDLIILGEGHEARRRQVRACLQQLGNPNFVYINGREMLPDAKYLSADFVHPTVEGHIVMSDYLLRAVRGTLG